MTMGGTPGQDRQVPAIVRAAKILDLLAESDQPLGISDLARRLGLPKSSVHLICSTMLELGLLSRRGESQFVVGPHVLRWSDAFQGQSDLIREFQQLTAESGVLSGLAVNLTVLNGTDVLYVACRNGQHPLGVRFGVGMLLPAVFTATGKAILSTRRPAEVEAFVGDRMPLPMTSKSVRSVGELMAELAETRRRGYSIDNGQLREGMFCLAAPIFDSSSQSAVAGVAIGLLQSEVTPASEQELGASIVAFANELSRRLGARLPQRDHLPERA